MTPQEQQMLQDLTNRVNQTSLPDKDSEAEQYLQQTLGRNPDALYILAQTVLVQQYALDQAKKQMDDLRSQQQAPVPAVQKHTSFLGNLLGMNDEAPRQQVPYTPVGNAPPPPQYGSTYGGGQPQYAPAPAGYGQPAQGGFLRNAMQTAAGVAAGAFAFQGIENLMSGFGHHAGYGGGSGFGDLGGGAPREEVINNYYGDGDRDREGGPDESRDIEDRRDDDSFGSRLADADDPGTQDDSSDNSADDSNYDPGGNDSSF